jgi:ABC-type dipeptide/oligopeptide/nickel transport system permease subunit
VRVGAIRCGGTGGGFPGLIIFPGSALTVTLLSLNFLRDGLRDAFDSQATARR